MKKHHDHPGSNQSWDIYRALSPHPNPLPEEKEPVSTALEKSLNADLASRCQMVPPLPKGEGWGEGERDVRQPEVFRQLAGLSILAVLFIAFHIQAADQNLTYIDLVHRLT